MRWLFLFMLALNLAYIAWQTVMPGPVIEPVVTPLAEVPTIVLLSELAMDKPYESTDAVAPMQQPVAETGPAEVRGEAAQTTAAAVIQGKDAPLEESEPAMAERLSEAPSDAIVPQPAAQVLESERCYTLGPFRDLDILRSLTREIRSYVVTADFRGQEQKERTLYWVYLKPEQDRAKALAMGERLKASKVKDFYIIREGENNNAISLGYFRNQESATGLAKKVSKIGFDVQLESVFKTFTVYWLDYRLAEGVTIPATIFDKYLPAAESDNVRPVSRDCGG